MKESGLRIRVESHLRAAFIDACKQDDLTASQVLRTFMRTYIEQQTQGDQPDLFQGVRAHRYEAYGEKK